MFTLVAVRTTASAVFANDASPICGGAIAAVNHPDIYTKSFSFL